MDSELVIELRRLEQQCGTGVLIVGDGAFHLAEGAVVAAECARTTMLDRMVVASGVATTEQWRRARAGDEDRLLAGPRLETLALLSVFDAAYLLLAAPVALEFRAGPPHWLADACRITPGALIHECARRGDPHAGPWPVELVDRVAVVPVRRVRRRRVVLTGGQAEVLAAVDARRSITGIAEDLGRTTYGCLLAVRELTAAGLLEPPVMVAFADPIGAPGPTVTADAPDRTAGPATDSMPPLRRRVRQAAAVAVPDRWEPPDRDVLIRLRAALEELA
ncbi:hypothetical protein [Nocardia seriolae]|uniref:Uncharacterized protein n=1 Tax=Nocardia seriolae TaxID=37332 RepID=A0A0B8NHS4_9NOCA|nr:hypothetical protein [Nocardia seriolae]APB00556.1 hypothetical protein NS506_06520 [Nocardia seriolae]MTJ61947.1 hypothetical protein [Nocardia seriolae]MTJ73236.1 hypothetical protein [Nocardia seriolae]MTJ90026.1 hypothetical protein [Nocardia seriolae]MTK33999.1 hypothetical protein [Nocardia seriolae]